MKRRLLTLLNNAYKQFILAANVALSASVSLGQKRK